MKVLLATFLICFSVVFVAAQDYNETDVTRFREIRDKQFRDSAVSPLKPEDFSNFEGLNYYPLSETYRVKATFTKTEDEKPFMMPTSSVFSHKYLKIGVLKFKLGEQELSLNAYRREYEPTDTRAAKAPSDLFIPFRDLTSGKETYGTGRYIYIKPPAVGNEVELDFNLSFNPSCAYGNPNFSCPIPPRENFLQAEIKAGEKIYKNFGQKE